MIRILCLLLALAGAAAARAFDLDDLAAKAQAIAAEPYRDRQTHAPDWMLEGKMTYDQWRDIRFRPDQALWRADDLPFQVQLFHPGLYFDRTVVVNEIDAKGVHEIPFSPDRFDYGKNDFAARIPRDIGYAGLRVHAPIKGRGYFDEVAVFLGASYFRAIGRDNVWGLSARGLAIDTVEPGGEEFPRFIEFWLERPAPAATALVLYALLDSPSASGAYRFEITPGAATRMAVDARVYPRQTGRKIGIAPLTSMFFFGENRTRSFEDFRPEVHDSDGLLLHLDTGEWLWRPLDNPTRINAAGFLMHNPRGFGLLQRDRDFANYQDIETRTELRPSAWVEPRGDWGDGRVELVEIPTGNEKLDNIVAYWVPDAPPRPGDRLAYAYDLTWYLDDPRLPPGGRAVATRRDRGTLDTPRDGYRWVVDFEGPALAALAADQAPRALVSAGNGARLYDEHIYRNPVTGGWRLSFQIKPTTPRPVELRAYLEREGDVLTETWSSVWLP